MTLVAKSTAGTANGWAGGSPDTRTARDAAPGRARPRAGARAPALLLALCLFALLAPSLARAQAAPPASTSASTSAFTPTFTIVPVYESVARYARALEAEPDTPATELYYRHVVEPHQDECKLKPIGGMFQRVPTYARALAHASEELRASDTRAVVHATLERVWKMLPLPDAAPEEVTVCITVMDPDTTVGRREMRGLSGYTEPGFIVLEVYPESGWLAGLPYLVAHEYHHLVAFAAHVDVWRPLTLLEMMLVEGRADAFAQEAFPEVRPPWTSALSPAEEQRLWAAMAEQLDATDRSVVGRFMFGGRETPRWAGYTVGFRIMRALLERHPQLDIADWTAMDARELLAKSRYGQAR